MVFSSLVFLFFFLPLTLFFYYLGPKKARNGILLAASLLFYAWGEPVYILLMLFSAISDYIHGMLIHHFRLTNPSKAKLALISSILINIGILSFFKYADFLIGTLNSLTGATFHTLDLPLPIGISFYTFQTMSYCIDIYRSRVLPQKSPIALATYICLFPQLIAGPIVRYEDIAKDLLTRKWNVTHFSDGVSLFIIGLGKKVLLANNIGMLWNNIQQQDVSELSILSAWLGITAFAFQIYFDFSGYSDMARGLGKMFGFHFPKNFDYPYTSKSVTEFWRRWHMTLGNWFRDYVYIPLGGSKAGKLSLYRNLFIVWGLTGLWHGASWNFVLWGLYFGVLIAFEKAGLLRMLKRLPAFLQHLYLLFIILIGWVLFVLEDVSSILKYLSLMFGLSDNQVMDSNFLYYFSTHFMIICICIIAALPLGLFRADGVRKVLMPLYYTVILILSTAYLVDESYNPFLYFRF